MHRLKLFPFAENPQVPLHSHTSSPTALLALTDGTVFTGKTIGTTGQTTGEVVFNTAVFGYQDIITDPASFQQIIAFTYPHIGNCGINTEDMQSRKVFAAGLVIHDLPLMASNFRSEQSLQDYLRSNQVVAIANIDTRKLTRHLRAHGSQNGCIWAFEAGITPSQTHIQQAVEMAKSAAPLSFDLAQTVSTPSRYTWTQGEWTLGRGYSMPEKPRWKVVVYDFGVRNNILRMLAQRGCAVTVVPAQTPAREVLALQPDGVLFSNGPGDVQNCSYAIETARAFMEKKIPLFGISLGHQILAHACGAQTYKLKVGHHGANHPVKNLETGRVHIANQNHDFVVDAQTLPPHLRATYINLFDGSLQGLEHTECPAFSFQGYPEGTSDSTDTAHLFDRFVQLMRNYRTQTQGASS